MRLLGQEMKLSLRKHSSVHHKPPLCVEALTKQQLSLNRDPHERPELMCRTPVNAIELQNALPEHAAKSNYLKALWKV